MGWNEGYNDSDNLRRIAAALEVIAAHFQQVDAREQREIELKEMRSMRELFRE